jgi:hypothetical protein
VSNETSGAPRSAAAPSSKYADGSKPPSRATTTFGTVWIRVLYCLVQADALVFEFPAGVDAILSTYALSLVPECAELIDRGAAALSPGGRWAVLRALASCSAV